MKTTMKKVISILAAVMLLIQVAPALMEGYTSGIIEGSDSGFRDALDIVSDNGAFMLNEARMKLTANEDYQPVWTSSNEEVVRIHSENLTAHSVEVEAVGFGDADVTATVGKQTKTFRITVINPENYENRTGEQPDGKENTEISASKIKLLIVVNGATEIKAYTGEAQNHRAYSAICADSRFNASLVKTTRDITVNGTDCGYYKMNLKDSDFIYEDDNVTATFVVNDGYMKIVPAKVTVAANPAEKQAGEADPELTATVTGLYGEDTVDYTFERYPGEDAGEYIIDVTGEEKQGNYKVQYVPGVMTITEAPAVELEPLNVWVTTTHPADEPVEYGMELTLVAQVTGAEEGEYTIQWQYSADMQTWTDIPGANGLTYTFTADGETVTYAWRAVADRIQK